MTSDSQPSRSLPPPGPLAGVRVLDLTRLLPGGHATLILAELGADVVKVEDPRGGDGTRLIEPRLRSGESGMHLVLNRGKRSVTIDTATDEGRAQLKELVRHADVLIDSFRPGVLGRMGLAPATLAELNATLVHVEITAFGADSQRAGHDLNALGESGVLSLTPGGTPALPASPMADLSAGFQAVIAVFAGLRARDLGRPLGELSISMTDAAMGLLGLAEGAYIATGETPRPGDPDLGGYLTGALACYDVYECADRAWVTVAAIEPKFFSNLLKGLGLDVELWAPRQQDTGAQSELRLLIAQRFATEDRDRWLSTFEELEACVGPAYNVDEAFRQAVRRGRVALTTVRTRDGEPTDVVRAAPWFDSAPTPRAPNLGAPNLGQHNDEVLAEWSDPDQGKVSEGGSNVAVTKAKAE